MQVLFFSGSCRAPSLTPGNRIPGAGTSSHISQVQLKKTHHCGCRPVAEVFADGDLNE